METVTDRLVGTKIGRYRIEALLGQGRGASVYRAFDQVVDRTVAIKVLDAGTARDRQLVEAFLSDTRVLAALRHPHILPIYEVAEQAGMAYFVRQLTDGGTLRSRLPDGKQLPVGEAAALLRPVATALDYAHRQGIVHRNLRPTNILLTADGHVFVTDFTLPGKEHQTSAATTVVNATTAPAYVSPEQARGGAIDGRSDIYVLAVILYEALVGRPPFQIEGPTESARTVIARHLQEEPPPARRANPAIGPNVETVLSRGLAKDPEKRYPTAAALFYALSEADELDRADRRQGEVAAKGDSGRVPRDEATQPSLPTVYSAAPASAAAELDDLLATLTNFDSAPAEGPPVAAAAPTPAAPTAAATASTASKVAEAAPPRQATQMAPAATTAPKRAPWLMIGGVVAALAIVIVVALTVITRGGQDEQVAVPPAVPSASVAAAVVTDPAPAATVAPSQPAPSVVAAVPSPVATTAVAPSAAATATIVAAPAASQPAAPVRREAIVYAETRSDSNAASLVAISPDGTDRRQLIDLPGHAWGPHIATDGRSIAFSVGSGTSTDQTFVGGLTGKGQHDLYLANLDGSAPTRLTTTTAWNAGWSWSPDGTTLAFTSNRDGNWEIYLMTFPGQEIKRLTTNEGQDAWPNWAPDGEALIFMSSRDGYPQLYRMDDDGRNVERLITSEAADSYPVISPNGRKIAYISQGIGSNENDIFVADLDGSNATRLTDTGDNGQPAWSPDSTRLAFASSRDGGYNIYVVRADGTGLTRLTDAPGDEVTPTWGTIELVAEASGPAPIAQLPLGGAVALAFGPSIGRRLR